MPPDLKIIKITKITINMALRVYGEVHRNDVHSVGEERNLPVAVYTVSYFHRWATKTSERLAKVFWT